jgi:hypothetical protein
MAGIAMGGSPPQNERVSGVRISFGQRRNSRNRKPDRNYKAALGYRYPYKKGIKSDPAGFLTVAGTKEVLPDLWLEDLNGLIRLTGPLLK